MTELHTKKTVNEICELLYISRSTWDSHPVRYKQVLSQKYKWHKEGRYFVLDEVIGDYEKKRKQRDNVSAEEKQAYSTERGMAFMKNKVKEERNDGVTGQWMNSSLLARMIRSEPQYPYNDEEETTARYCSNFLNDSYDVHHISWRAQSLDKMSHWEMTPEELLEWNEMMAEYLTPDQKEKRRQKKAILSDYLDGGEITKEVAMQRIFELEVKEYEDMLRDWHKTHNFTPVRYRFRTPKNKAFKD